MKITIFKLILICNLSKVGIHILSAILQKIKNVGTEYHQKPIITCYPRAFEVIDADKEIFELDSQEKRALTLVLKRR